MRAFRKLQEEITLICDGCGAYIDDSIVRHEWFEEIDDDQPSAYYHVDCCPLLHVSNGDCGDEE
jgi:hypothetical protein